MSDEISMSESSAADTKIHHVLIPRSALFFDRPVFFNLFVKLNDKFVKVLNEGEHADAERIDKYLAKNENVLYIQSTSIERFMDGIFASLFDKVAMPGPVLDRVRAFIRCVELCYLDIKLVRPHADKFMRLEILTQAGYELFKNQDVRKILLYEMAHSLESTISRQAILGGSLGLALYQEQSDCPALAFKSLFMGAILRDLSLGEGETPEKESYFTHPERTIRILHQYNVVDDTMETMIRQHHETPLGTGFPLGLKRIETYQPAQFLHLGDWLVNQMEQQLQFPQCAGADSFVEHVQASLPEENQRRLPLILRVLAATLQIPIEVKSAAS